MHLRSGCWGRLDLGGTSEKLWIIVKWFLSLPLFLNFLWPAIHGWFPYISGVLLDLLVPVTLRCGSEVPKSGAFGKTCQTLHPVLSNLWLNQRERERERRASVSPLRERLTRMLMLTLAWVQVHIVLYTVVGRLGWHLLATSMPPQDNKKMGWQLPRWDGQSEPFAEMHPQLSASLGQKWGKIGVAIPFIDPEETREDLGRSLFWESGLLCSSPSFVINLVLLSQRFLQDRIFWLGWVFKQRAVLLPCLQGPRLFRVL